MKKRKKLKNLAAGDLLTDEQKVVDEAKIAEAQEAIKALEKDILAENEKPLDLSGVFEEPRRIITSEEFEIWVTRWNRCHVYTDGSHGTENLYEYLARRTNDFFYRRG